jgi:hypothetical protein
MLHLYFIIIPTSLRSLLYLPDGHSLDILFNLKDEVGRIIEILLKESFKFLNYCLLVTN